MIESFLPEITLAESDYGRDDVLEKESYDLSSLEMGKSYQHTFTFDKVLKSCKLKQCRKAKNPANIIWWKLKFRSEKKTQSIQNCTVLKQCPVLFVGTSQLLV